jgi:hypothetical protein
MKAALFKGKGTIEPGERPDPSIKEPTDAVVRVGDDLYVRAYRGRETAHEAGPEPGKTAPDRVYCF